MRRIDASKPIPTLQAGRLSGGKRTFPLSEFARQRKGTGTVNKTELIAVLLERGVDPRAFDVDKRRNATEIYVL
ncbi:hypothetical protein [Sphingomonas koreensis]|jgi:hypothetical protein|uniref:hypothetical protein n=1 Tax=Sphingomonas koreensis TaxID=93064 RepID=UPI000F7DEFF8|nr:hypothetical protein [Sphingomonas koreensis]